MAIFLLFFLHKLYHIIPNKIEYKNIILFCFTIIISERQILQEFQSFYGICLRIFICKCLPLWVKISFKKNYSPNIKIMYFKECKPARYLKNLFKFSLYLLHLISLENGYHRLLNNPPFLWICLKSKGEVILSWKQCS